ncbi:hypothetical protein AAFF27_13765 [Xylophilus sp. GW821-FHT01B05]
MIQPTILLNTATLKALAESATPPASTAHCACGLHKALAWESITEDRWPAALLEPLGTLRDPAVDEPTFEEFHPDGTRYDSADAPIAVAYFPFNRSDVFRCGSCGRLVLRYTEFGGYYIDHRVRLVDAALISA